MAYNSAMTNAKYDLVVIGAGSGGVRAARIAAGHGARVAICEESRVGGTCVIRGCVPKKLLVYASEFGAHFADSAGFGWHHTEAPAFSWTELIAAKDAEIDRLNAVYHRLLADAGVDLYASRAHLLDAHTVAVGDQVLQADKVLIAVGGRPWRPDIPGAELAITSDEAFHLSDMPQQVLIQGGGYIALEFAGIFNGLGAEVTLVYRGDRVLRGFDEAVREAVEAGLRGRGIHIEYGVSVSAIHSGDSGPALRADLSDGRTLPAEVVMMATGRVPYTWDLGLGAAGVAVGERGEIVVDDDHQTSVPSIFAVGDVTDRVNLTPVALMEGHAFADKQFAGLERPMDHANVPAAVFSQPPVGTVGLSEQAARAAGHRVKIYQSRFTPMKYTLAGRSEKALMKLVVDADTDKVLGVHAVGPDAPEMLQGFAVAVRAGLTKADFDRTVGIHPTAAEELVTLRQPLSTD